MDTTFSGLQTGDTFTRVAIHVRRTDHVEFLSGQNRFAQPPNYYARAMDYYRGCDDGDVEFVVLSDDIAWCEENIRGGDVICSRGLSPGEDLALASLCDH